MLLNTLVAAAVLSLAASAQGCATIPLCCNQLFPEPPDTVTNSLGVQTYSIGEGCVPIEDPPADFLLLW